MTIKILIIDDDKNALRMISYVLEKAGYEVAICSDAAEGIQKSLAELPQLIIMDVMMPGLDGYEATRRIRSIPQTETTPILMLTAKSQLDDKVIGFDSGADDFISKPVASAELLARVRALLSRAKTEKKFSAPLIGLIGAKGGVGLSTLAINVAVALTKSFDNVILLDMQPAGGSITLQLGLGISDSLAILLGTKGDQATQKQIRGCILPHPCGLRILPSPYPRAVQYQPLSDEIYDRIVETIAETASIILMDLGAMLDEGHIHLLLKCQRVCLVTETTKLSLDLAQQLLRQLRDLGILGRTTIIPIKRDRLSVGYNRSDIEMMLNADILGMISASPELIWQASDSNKPIILLQPESVPGGQYNEIATKLIQ